MYDSIGRQKSDTAEMLDRITQEARDLASFNSLLISSGLVRIAENQQLPSYISNCHSYAFSCLGYKAGDAALFGEKTPKSKLYSETGDLLEEKGFDRVCGDLKPMDLVVYGNFFPHGYEVRYMGDLKFYNISPYNDGEGQPPRFQALHFGLVSKVGESEITLRSKWGSGLVIDCRLEDYPDGDSVIVFRKQPSIEI